MEHSCVDELLSLITRADLRSFEFQLHSAEKIMYHRIMTACSINVTVFN